MRRISAALAATVIATTLAHAGVKPGEVAAARAQVAVEPWLALMDAGEYEKTWDEASKGFQVSTTKEKWAEASKRLREPLGKLVSRKRFSAAYVDRIHGAAPGKYVIVQNDTTFEKKGMTVEAVTLVLDPSGAWRVAGYSIK